MEPQQVIYDMCRLYLADKRGTIPGSVYDKLHGAIRARDIDTLASCTTQSRPIIVGREGWRTLMQVEAFFKKNVLFSSRERCRQAAMSSFNRGELICRITNRRLDHYYCHADRLDPRLTKQLIQMEKSIDKLLGSYPDFLEQLPKLVRVTSGATSTKSRRRAMPHLRVSRKPHSTRRSAPYLDALSRYFGYDGVRVKESVANRVEFVPKNWKTDRTIACEPEGNMLLQLAFDSYTKRRLKRIGVNLRSQFWNQTLAKEGSIHGSYATVDLSMASDTLSYNCVAWLLPDPWFRYLCDIRSERAGGAVECEYAKFSSMGNGATFTLETLIFSAAVLAVGSKRFAVYGDDIVIETELVPDLMRLLQFLGFIPNHDKTHLEGPFRESCGVNCYEGIDITPKYVREMDSRKATQCHVINSLMTITWPGEELWDYLVDLVGRLDLPLVPYNLQTTSGVFVNTEYAKRKKLLRTKRWVVKFKAYAPVNRQRRVWTERALFLWHLDAHRRDGHYDPHGYIERSRYTISSHRYRRKWVHWSEGPVAGAPLQLDSWSECLAARKLS